MDSFWREIATNQDRLTPSEDALVWRLRGQNMPWDKIERRIKNTRAIAGGGMLWAGAAHYLARLPDVP